VSSAAARLARLSRNLGDLDKVMVKTAGDVVTKALLAKVAQDTGGDRRMSGFGKRGSALDVDVKPLGTGVRITPARRQAGMWSILNTGAKPHDVVAKGAPGGRRRRGGKGAKALSLGGGRFAVRVHNVRSPAKHTWIKARDKSVPEAAKAVRDEFHKAVNGG
jgi:hypothetical protein